MRNRTLAIIAHLIKTVTFLFGLLFATSLVIAVPSMQAQSLKTKPLTTSQIIANVESRHGGKVITLVKSEDGRSYRVRLLRSDAKVLVFDIKADTGKSANDSAKDK